MEVGAPLSTLNSLEPDGLYAFVFGPGKGEGIALRLPGGAWVLLDGCTTTEGTTPIADVLRQYSDGAPVVELMLLTHPHGDHAEGFAELVDDLSPKRVAVTGIGARQHLAAEAAWWQAAKASVASSTRMKAGVVLTALRRIDVWDEENPGQLCYLHQGVTALTVGPTTVLVCSPDQGLLSAWWNDGTIKDIATSAANRLSAVVEIQHGKTKVVLGADLPETENMVECPSGWRNVLSWRPSIADYTGWKVSHHGSREALHPTMVAGAKGRSVVLTPFNSASLPRCDDDDGLDILLGSADVVLLTAPSASKKFQAALDRGNVVSREDLAAVTAALKSGTSWKVDDTLWRMGTATATLDAVWCVGFDANGAVTGRWRGRAACAVVP